MTEHCSNCGELCSGKLNIEARKGTIYTFCQNCWGFMYFKSDKEIRQALSRNKYDVTV